MGKLIKADFNKEQARIDKAEADFFNRHRQEDNLRIIGLGLLISSFVLLTMTIPFAIQGLLR